jgi:hypothetical protein
MRETGSASPYIGSVLDAAFSKAQAVVVLLTGDDLVRLRKPFWAEDDGPEEKEPRPQARPNVLFEAGIAFAKHPARTVLVTLGQVKPFSNIEGLHIVRMDDSAAARNDLVERLKTAGCSPDTVGKDWLKPMFDAAVERGVNGDRELSGETNLSDEELKVLLELVRNDQPATAGALAQRTGLSVERTKLHLTKLVHLDRVNVRYQSGSQNRYSLKDGGRRYLFEKGLLK